MKTFSALLLCTGLVPFLAKGIEIKGNAKRFILSFSTCNDAIDNCASYPPSVCTDPTYSGWAKDNCKSTCNLCSSGGGGGVPTPGIPSPVGGSGCSDKLGDCSSYGTSACSGQYLQWATENCAKTCSLCGSRSSSGSASQPGAISGTSSGCFYNNQLYQQDQSWNDACKYKCRCTDGTSGKYECRQLCLNWNLPPTCSMTPPAAGKCCPKPSCPPNILLQYPDGYVEE